MMIKEKKITAPRVLFVCHFLFCALLELCFFVCCGAVVCLWCCYIGKMQKTLIH